MSSCGARSRRRIGPTPVPNRGRQAAPRQGSAGPEGCWQAVDVAAVRSGCPPERLVQVGALRYVDPPICSLASANGPLVAVGCPSTTRIPPEARPSRLTTGTNRHRRLRQPRVGSRAVLPPGPDRGRHPVGVVGNGKWLPAMTTWRAARTVGATAAGSATGRCTGRGPSGPAGSPGRSATPSRSAPAARWSGWRRPAAGRRYGGGPLPGQATERGARLAIKRHGDRVARLPEGVGVGAR